MNKEAFIHGIYPRSDSLIATSRGVGGSKKRFTLEQHKAVQEINLRGIFQIQENLAYVEDGKFTWEDLFRPIAVTSNGFEHLSQDQGEGEVTRWFGNNAFYRKPVILGKLTPNFDRLDEFFPPVANSSKWKVTLPLPFTFAKLAEDRTTDKFSGTLENITQLMKATIEYLEGRGVSFIQLNEPYIPYYGSQKKDIDALASCLKSLDSKKRKAILAIHFQFGDGAKALRAFEEMDTNIDAIGVDFQRTLISDIPTNLSRPLIAGVINSESSLVEKQEEIEQFIDELLEHTKPATLYLTHNSDFEYQDIANKKVKLLVDLTKK